MNYKNKSSVPIVKIGFNKEWEIENWYTTIFNKAKYGLKGGSSKWGLGGIPADMPSLLEGHNKDEAMQIIRERLEVEIKRTEIAKLMETSIKQAEEKWKQLDEEFFSILALMLDVPVIKFEPCYYAYFTLSTRCPFDKNAFMFSRNYDFVRVAMHEIMHIEFLKAYKKHCIEKGLNEEKIGNLKEILTVLLNEDAIHLLTRSEPGYTKHIELRKQVLEMYKECGGKNGDFKSFLDKVIPLVKRADFN